MVKKSLFTRILIRNNKKSDQSKAANPSQIITTTGGIPASTSSTPILSSSSKNKNQGIDPILWASPKQQHLLSLLRNAKPDNITALDTEGNLQESSFYFLRLYLATVQKLKCQQPTTMEKQRAIYHILSCLVVQQELERFDPAFEPIGRKPRKTRYISALLGTPTDCIMPYRHPVLEACKRKPFVETFDVIIPSALSSASSCSTSSISTSCTYPPYKRKQCETSSHPALPPTPLQSSCSDSSLHSPTSDTIYFNHKTNYSVNTLNDDEDNIPLAILKTRKKK